MIRPLRSHDFPAAVFPQDGPPLTVGPVPVGGGRW